MSSPHTTSTAAKAASSRLVRARSVTDGNLAPRCSEARESLRQREHGGEQVAVASHSLQHLIGGERQLRGVLRVQAGLHLVPRHGSRDGRRSRARGEYTATVVLWRSFWLQSTSTRPPRRSLACRETTSSGSACSSSSATALAKGLVAA